MNFLPLCVFKKEINSFIEVQSKKLNIDVKLLDKWFEEKAVNFFILGQEASDLAGKGLTTAGFKKMIEKGFAHVFAQLVKWLDETELKNDSEHCRGISFFSSDNKSLESDFNLFMKTSLSQHRYSMLIFTEIFHELNSNPQKYRDNQAIVEFHQKIYNEITEDLKCSFSNIDNLNNNLATSLK